MKHLGLLALLLVGCGGGGEADDSPCAAKAGAFGPLSTRCDRFVDAQGRVFVLHGMNARVEGLFDVSFSDGRTALEPIPPFTLEDARRLRQLGFNFLRLPINWSGLEPTETGGIDAAYLERIAATVDLCRQAGVLVLLDFHQDAYSKEIGEDGAPLWAIQPPPDMLLGGPLTDLGDRRLSPQVMRSFATFFGSAEPGPRLRTRFAAAAAAVARRFASDDTVFAYEIMNEPVAADAELPRFHAEVARAIRAVDTRHLIAFEPTAYRNQLDIADVPATTFEQQFGLGGMIYAPHIYTVSFSSNESLRQSFTRADLRPSNAAAVNEGLAWGAPVLITEWGYGPADTRAKDYLELQTDIQDELMLSAAFWVWKEDSQGSWGMYERTATGWNERPLLRNALSRPRPEAIAGWPQRWSYDRAARRFTLAFTGSAKVTAPSLIYIPGPDDFPATLTVTCDTRPVTPSPTRDPATGLIAIPCNGPGQHDIVVTP